MIEAASKAKVEIETICGKRGSCRSCRIKLVSGQFPLETMQDKLQLGREELQEQFRLGCQTKLIENCIVGISPPRTESGLKVLNAEPALKILQGGIKSGVTKTFVQPKPPMDENEETSDYEEIIRDIVPNLPINPHFRYYEKFRYREARGGLTVTTFNGQVVDLEKEHY